MVCGPADGLAEVEPCGPEVGPRAVVMRRLWRVDELAAWRGLDPGAWLACFEAALPGELDGVAMGATHDPVVEGVGVLGHVQGLRSSGGDDDEAEEKVHPVDLALFEERSTPYGVEPPKGRGRQPSKE